MNVIDEWLKSESAKRDALKFKNACDSMDSLRYCTFIIGRSCGKTELARQLAILQDKIYDTLGIKDYLNKVYGDPMLKFKNGDYLEWMPSGSKSLKELAKEYGCDCDYNFTIDWSENIIKFKEEETNNMVANRYLRRNEWCFGFKDDKDVWHKIEIEKRGTSYYGTYRVRLYRVAELRPIAADWDFIRIFSYETWEQVVTQLMCDLHVFGIVIRRADMRNITSQLETAGRIFRESGHQDAATLYQPRSKDEVRYTAPHNAMPKIEKVIFNPPATIVQWKDGTKTIVKCQEGDEFDWEKGLAMAYVKRAFNNERTYYGLFKKNEPCINLPNSNMKYDPRLAKEVRIIVPKDLPVTGDIIVKAHDLILQECDKKWENGIEVGI